MTWNLIDTRDESVVMTAENRRALRNKAIRAGLIKFERGKTFNHLIVGVYDMRPEGYVPFKTPRINNKARA
jgi:hypothetical protein